MKNQKAIMPLLAAVGIAQAQVRISETQETMVTQNMQNFSKLSQYKCKRIASGDSEAATPSQTH